MCNYPIQMEVVRIMCHLALLFCLATAPPPIKVAPAALLAAAAAVDVPAGLCIIGIRW